MTLRSSATWRAKAQPGKINYASSGSDRPCELLIFTQALIDDLEADGHLALGSARALGCVKTGVALRANAPALALDSAAEPASGRGPAQEMRIGHDLQRRRRRQGATAS